MSRKTGQTSKKAARFDVYPDASGEFRWRLKAANGRIVADSAESYVTRSGARAGVVATLGAVASVLASNAAMEDVA